MPSTSCLLTPFYTSHFHDWSSSSPFLHALRIRIAQRDNHTIAALAQALPYVGTAYFNKFHAHVDLSFKLSTLFRPGEMATWAQFIAEKIGAIKSTSSSAMHHSKVSASTARDGLATQLCRSPLETNLEYAATFQNESRLSTITRLAQNFDKYSTRLIH